MARGLDTTGNIRDDKNLIALKLILSHIVLPCGLCVGVFLFPNDSLDFLLLFLITESALLLQRGCWEFLGFKFRNIFLGSLEIIVLSRLLSATFVFLSETSLSDMGDVIAGGIPHRGSYKSFDCDEAERGSEFRNCIFIQKRYVSHYRRRKFQN